MLSGVLVCITSNMDQRKQGRRLSEDIGKKITCNPLKGNGYEDIYKHFDVPVTTVAHIVQAFRFHGKIDEKLMKYIGVRSHHSSPFEPK